MKTTEIKNIVSEHKNVINNFDETFYKSIKLGIEFFRNAIISDSNIFLCGNGGSAADCQHIAAELIGRFKKNRRPFKAFALTTDSSILTCISNDFNYEKIFSRQLKAMGNKGDLLVSISTSGNSENIINVIKEANKMKIKTLSLLGGNGGEAKKISNHSIIVPSKNTARIQEIHILIAHIICEFLEDL